MSSMCVDLGWSEPPAAVCAAESEQQGAQVLHGRRQVPDHRGRNFSGPTMMLLSRNRIILKIRIQGHNTVIHYIYIK